MTAASKLASLIVQIAPPLEIYVPFLVEKLRCYVQLFEEMDKHDGSRTGAMVERYAHLAPERLALAASRIDPLLSGYTLATVGPEC